MGETRFTGGEFRKQVSFFLPIRDHRRLVLHAARLRRPIVQVLLDWVRPHIEALPEVDAPAEPGED